MPNSLIKSILTFPSHLLPLPLLDSIVQALSLCTVLKEICTLLGVPVPGLILGDPVCLWNGELSSSAASADVDPEGKVKLSHFPDDQGILILIQLHPVEDPALPSP